MAVSTVEVRSHGIRLTGQDQTQIAPSRSADRSTAIVPANYLQSQTVSSTPSYSMSGVLITKGQQDATALQIAGRSLHYVAKELTQIKRNLTQAMSRGVQNTPNLPDQLGRSKRNIEQILDRSRIDGQRVVDNELNVRLDTADRRRFSIPGLNIHRLSERSEQIRLDFVQGKSVIVSFDGQDSRRTVQMLDRSLIPLGMRASVADDGNILFETSETSYQRMQQKVFVTGEGHRFPAGQANQFNLKSEPDGIAELHFDLSSRDGIKQSIAKVNHHLHRVQSSLDQLQDQHAGLAADMASLQQQMAVISTSEVNQKLDALHASAGQFATTYQALNAQANVKRHTVVALLK